MANQHAQRISPVTPPPSGRPPKVNLASRQIGGLHTHLKTYHQTFAPLFQRREQRHWSLKYMEGQMLSLERKSIEPMARALEGGDVQAMQQFASASPWPDDEIIRVHQREVAKTLGQKDGIIIGDGSDFPKQGQNSVGVARQHCGALGKTANCQAGVFLAYASELLAIHCWIGAYICPNTGSTPNFRRCAKNVRCQKRSAFTLKMNCSRICLSLYWRHRRYRLHGF